MLSKVLTEKSIQIINYVLERTDIYLVKSFKPNYLEAELRRPYSIHSSRVRWDFLYKNYGLATNINDFNSEFNRFLEYTAYGDYPYSLRQKFNIISSLLECNMETFLPVHVTVKPLNNENTEIDLNDLSKNSKNYEVICHPGFTRGVGSVFLNTPLKKALVYINKSHNLKLRQNEQVIKLSTKEDILKQYDYVLKGDLPEGNKIIYDFEMFKGEVKEGIKYHIPTETPILKVNNITDINFDEKYHNNCYYRENTFNRFNEFCKTLFSNRIKIFTDKNQKGKLSEKFYNNCLLLQKKCFLTDMNWYSENYTSLTNKQKADAGGLIAPKGAFSKDSKFYEFYHNIYFDFKKYFTPTQTEFFINNTSVTGGSKLIEVEKFSVSKEVKENNYKGIIIYISADMINKLDRLFYELLYCFSKDASLVTTKCNGLQIINCSHEYWNTGKSYKELILNDSFLSYE